MIFAANIRKNQILKLSSQKEGKLIIRNISIDPQSQQAFVYLKVPFCQEKTLIAKLNQLNQCAFYTSIQLPLHKKSVQQLISLNGKVHLIGTFILKEEDIMIKNIKNILNIEKYSYQLQIKEDSQFKSELQGLQVPAPRLRRSRYQVKTAIKSKQQRVKLEQKKDNKKKGDKKSKSLLQMMNEISNHEQEDQDQSYEAEEQQDDESSESQPSQQDVKQSINNTQQKVKKKEAKSDKIKQKNEKLAKTQGKSFSWARVLTNLEDEDEDQQDQNYQSKQQSSSSSSDSSKSSSLQKEQNIEKTKQQQSLETKEKISIKSKIITICSKEKPFEYMKPQKIPDFVFKN